MQLNPLRFEPTQMEGTKIYHFKETDEWLVIENNKIIIVCSTKEKAEYYLPLFREGDYVDIPKYNIKNTKITEVGRTIEGDVYYDTDDATFFEPQDVIPASNPDID